MGVNSSDMFPKLLCCFVVLSLMPVFVSAVPEEDTNFRPVHDSTDFPVGYFDVNVAIEYRLYYPAMQNGEDVDAAGNGPFPWVLFIGGEGIGIDEYQDVSTEIVKRGYLVLVMESGDDVTDENSTGEDVERAIEEIRIHNTLDPEEVGLYSQIDENHWVISGHGVGSHVALDVYLNWNNIATGLEFNQTQQPPRGIFGLGHIDEEYISSGQATQEFLTKSAPSPALGLFLTGTADGIADVQNEILPLVESNPPFGMHLMSVVGANHRQYSEWSPFIGSGGDNDATITKQEQISHAGQHILPFIDLITKGDHSSFTSAFNRENNQYTTSDSMAYLDENLNNSRFLNGDIFQPSQGTPFGPQSDVAMQINWSMRDLSSLDSINQNRLNISCWLQSSNEIITEIGYGGLNSNYTSLCVIPSAGTAPGSYDAVTQIMVDGAPTRWTVEVQRSDGPMWTNEPYAEVEIPQGGWVEITADELAVDPDGQVIRITSAEIENSSNLFEIQFLESNTKIRITHIADDTEDSVSRLLNISLRADGQYDDRANITLNMTLTDANNQLVIIGNPPQIRVDEDSGAFDFDVREIVSDPESMDLAVLLDGSSSSESDILTFSVENGIIEFIPIPDMNGVDVFNLSVSDMFNEPLYFELVVTVLPMDDPITLNSTSIQLEFDEDSSAYFTLPSVAYDPDGDEVEFLLNGSSELFEYSSVNGTVTIIGNADKNGNSELTLRVFQNAQNSENNSLNPILIPIQVNISAVDDQVGIVILDLTKLAPGAYNIRWLQSDADGVGVVVNANYSSSESDISVVESVCNVVDQSSVTRTCTDTISFDETLVSEIFFNLDLPDTALGENRFEIRLDYTMDSQVGEENDNADQSNPAITIGIAGTVILALVIAYFVSRKNEESLTIEPVVILEEEYQPSETGLLARARKTEDSD